MLSDIKVIEFDVLFEEVKAPPFSLAVFLLSFERDVFPPDEEEEEVVGLLRLLLSLSLESWIKDTKKQLSILNFQKSFSVAIMWF